MNNVKVCLGDQEVGQRIPGRPGSKVSIPGRPGSRAKNTWETRK